MPESEKIQTLRGLAKVFKEKVRTATESYDRVIRELDAELSEQPSAPKGFHTEDQHVWRRAVRNPALIARMETCSCGASRTMQL